MARAAVVISLSCPAPLKVHPPSALITEKLLKDAAVAAHFVDAVVAHFFATGFAKVVGFGVHGVSLGVSAAIARALIASRHFLHREYSNPHTLTH